MSEKAKTKSMEIEPLKYEGSVDDFRSWMDVFLARASSIPLVDAVSQQDVIKKATEKHKGGDILNIAQYYPQLITLYSEYAKSSKREVWRVTRVDPIHDDETIPPKKWATIMAVEVLNITTVEFLDGIYFHLLDENDKKIDYARVGFIGDDFSKYAQFIKDEWEKKDNVRVTKNERKQIILQTKPVGRKVDPWNPIAYDILNDGKENANLRAFEYWYKARRIENPGKSEREAFKKAMKREANRRNR